MCGIFMDGMNPRQSTSRVTHSPWRRLGRSKRTSPGILPWFIVIVGALSALLLAVYGLRNGGFGKGTHTDWMALKSEYAVHGEPIFFEELVPPDLPDHQNFFAAPPFDSLVSQNADGTSNLLTLALNPGRGIFVADLLAASSDGSGRATLDAIAGRLVAAGVTNPRTDYLLPGDRILAGLKELGIDMSPLKDVADRPGSRFPIDYTNLENPGLPHVPALEALADWLAIQAIAWISTGNSEAAMVDLLLIARLADSVAAEPFLESQNARRKLLDVFCACVATGLDRGTWNAEDLAAFREVLGRARPLADFALVLRGERARLNSSIDRVLDGTPLKSNTFLTTWLGEPPDQLKAAALRKTQVNANVAIQHAIDHLYDSAATPAEDAVPILPPSASLPISAQERLATLEEAAGAFRETEALILKTEKACSPEKPTAAVPN
jgi:hypothetical protein